MAKTRFILNETKKFEFEDGEWIEFKQELSFKEYQEIMRNIDVPVKIAEGKGEVKKEMKEFKNFDIAVPLLKIALVDWSFADKDGKKIECTHENIDKLTPRTVFELLAPVSELMHINAAEEKKSSQS